MGAIIMAPGIQGISPTLYKVIVQDHLDLPRGIAVDPLAGYELHFMILLSIRNGFIMFVYFDASISVLFPFLLMSGIGCGLWLWHSPDFSINFISTKQAPFGLSNYGWYLCLVFDWNVFIRASKCECIFFYFASFFTFLGEHRME